VCSALAGEGKTTVALGLAVAIASDHIDRRVVLVEADVQKPVLAADFRLDPQPGVAECLSLGVPLEEACRSTFIENLTILPAGGAVANAGRLLHSKRIIALAEQLRELFDVVILDVPAVLATSTATGLANQADGILFVVRAGVTPAPLVKQALSHFERGKVRGVVVNEARSSVPRWMRRILGL
jgi:capsular exopolysaccharide synthesis family protein